MRASDPVEDSSTGEGGPLDPGRQKHHVTPAYSHRGSEATGTFEIDVDVRGWSIQALQWLIIFGALGLLIGGAKWWSSRHEATIAGLATAPPPVTRPAPAAETNGDGTTASMAPQGAPVAGAPVASEPADYGSSTMPSAVPQMPDGSIPDPSGSGDLVAAPAGAAPDTIDVLTVRAPADVPYPRRIHDVTPEVPEGASVRRGIAVLTLLIDTGGDVAEVELLRSVDPLLDEAAIAAAWQWKFEPTLHDGRPVVVRSNFTVRFGY
ncbi:MAG: TonB family protein [Acidobacteriota bacterium]|jgi:protein TonB